MDQYLPIGVSRTKLEAPGGLYDSRTAGQLAALQAMGATKQLVLYGFAGCVSPVAHVGAKCILLNGTYVSSWKRQASKGGLTLGSGTHTITGARTRGSILSGNVVDTNNGDTVTLYFDNLAEVDTQGATFVFDIHVPVLTLAGGATHYDIEVCDDAAPGGAYTAIGTGATPVTYAFTAPGQSVRLTHVVSNADPNTHVMRYLAVRWATDAGTGTIAPVVAFSRTV